MLLKVLGAAAGGGLPQWNCACANCSAVRGGLPGISPRNQSQLAVSGDGESWYLINASPDLREQLHHSPALHPAQGGDPRNTPIRGVVLTSADLDHVLGLLLLREFTPVRIYSTPAVRSILQGNSFFSMLDRLPGQSRWVDLDTSAGFLLDEAIRCTPIPIPGGFPAYVGTAQQRQWNASEAIIGLIFEDATSQSQDPAPQRVAFLPAVPDITEELISLLATCSIVLFDGTFWSDNELQQLQPGTPAAREMGHLPIGGPGGTLERLADLNHLRKIFFHINNTNPILRGGSPEYNAVRRAGWEVAWDGMEISF